MENSLKHLPEFKAVLEQYHPSEHAVQVLASIRLVLLASPTSIGRNTIIKELIKTGTYRFLVSDTTRQPRVNNGVPEQNGREYWFHSEAEVLADLQAGKFLEAAIVHNQQVSGISVHELERVAQEQKIAVTDIEMVGVERIHAMSSSAIPIFVLPPSFDEWMHRLHSRGEMPPDEVTRRLTSAVHELEQALAADYYKFVVNDQLALAVRQVETIVEGTIDQDAQQSARKLIQRLLIDLRDFLV